MYRNKLSIQERFKQGRDLVGLSEFFDNAPNPNHRRKAFKEFNIDEVIYQKPINRRNRSTFADVNLSNIYQEQGMKKKKRSPFNNSIDDEAFKTAGVIFGGGAEDPEFNEFVDTIEKVAIEKETKLIDDQIQIMKKSLEEEEKKTDDKDVEVINKQKKNYWLIHC